MGLSAVGDDARADTKVGGVESKDALDVWEHEG